MKIVFSEENPHNAGEEVEIRDAVSDSLTDVDRPVHYGYGRMEELSLRITQIADAFGTLVEELDKAGVPMSGFVEKVLSPEFEMLEEPHDE